jgi:hypothetical protein
MTMVETGTYFGDMLQAVRGAFSRLYSVEVDARLYERAVRRFRDDSSVTIVHGDSADVLPQLLNSINEPALFWLDAHYSGGITAKGKSATPVLRELTAIIARDKPAHVILVDDAQCFGTWSGYPSVAEVVELVRVIRPDYKVIVQDDIIRIHPPEPA